MYGIEKLGIKNEDVNGENRALHLSFSLKRVTRTSFQEAKEAEWGLKNANIR